MELERNFTYSPGFQRKEDLLRSEVFLLGNLKRDFANRKDLPSINHVFYLGVKKYESDFAGLFSPELGSDFARIGVHSQKFGHDAYDQVLRCKIDDDHDG